MMIGQRPAPSRVSVKGLKAYDWQFHTAADPIGIADCRDLCRIDDPTQVIIDVEVPAGEGFDFLCSAVADPCDSGVDTGVICEVLQIRRDVETSVPGAAIVTILVTVPLTLVFRNCQGEEVCRCRSRARFATSTVMCVPEGLCKGNVVCRVFDIDASAAPVIQIDELDNRFVDVAVSVCIDIQVEVEANLAVCGRFAYPRKRIEIPSTAACTTSFRFPTGCPSIYPATSNCDVPVCVAPGNYPSSVGGITSGTVCVTQFSVCGGCNDLETNVILAILLNEPIRGVYNIGLTTDSESTFQTTSTGPGMVTVTITNAIGTLSGRITTVMIALDANAGTAILTSTAGIGPFNVTDIQGNILIGDACRSIYSCG